MDITDIVAETAQALRTVTTWVKGPEPSKGGQPRRALNQDSAELFETTGNIVTVDGIKLHYLQRGARDAPPVVYIHGANAYAEELFAGPLGDMLAKKYRVIAFDRPGFGRSERARGMAGPCRQAALIRNALAALEVDRPVLVGHSWGGALSLAYAVAYGRELRGLVNMSGWCFPSNQAMLSLLAFSVGPYINAMRAFAPPDVTRQMGQRMVEQVFEPDPVPAAFAYFSMEVAMRKSQMSANGEDLKALNADIASIEGRYPAISVPTEILVAMSDRIVDPARHGLTLARKLPAARVTKLPGRGHMAHHLDPQPFLDAVDRLMR